MGSAQMPLLEALTDKMRWHQARQSVLAENVANAETPGYRARDLKAYNFADHVREAFPAQFETAMTDPAHIMLPSTGGSNGFGSEEATMFETTPEGNAVTLEDQMMEVAANQMDYQAITTLYTRSLRIIRTALGRSA